MKKSIKYLISILIIGIIGYNSVYFKKISELKAAEKSFDATAYATDLINNKIRPVLNKAIALNSLVKQVTVAPAPIFKKYGHSLTIGSAKFFMVKGTGKIISIDDSGSSRKN